MNKRKWTKFEKIWLVVFLFLIVCVTVVFSISGTDYNNIKSILLNWVISPISAITGILCVVLVARGSIWNYAWGLVNCITYGFLAYQCGYYGDTILNIFYFLPFQFIGFIYWRKHLQIGSNEFVIMKKLNLKQMIFVTLGGIIATILVGLALFNIDHWFTTAMKRNVSIYNYIDGVFHIPYLGAIFDASTEILQIVAQILMTLAYAEQWIMWMLTNVITIVMWLTVIMSDIKTIAWVLPTLIMWIGYLINSVYGYVNWLKGAKLNV
jgi:nicotinamide mononucleotide transporter